VALDTILEPLCPPSEHTKQEHGYFSPAMPAAGRGKGAGRGGRCGLVQEVTGGMHPGGVRVDSSHEQSSRSPKGTLLYSTGREIGPINAQDHAADSRRQWKLRLASGPYRSRSRLEALQGFQAPDFSAPATGFRKAFQRDHERRPVNCCVSLHAPSTRPVLVRARGRGAVGRGHRAPRERSLRARPPPPPAHYLGVARRRRGAGVPGTARGGARVSAAVAARGRSGTQDAGAPRPCLELTSNPWLIRMNRAQGPKILG